MENKENLWKSININLNQIETTTDRAVLIKMPKSSGYADYHFWHPAKLVRRGRHSYAASISFTDEFTFKLFKNGKGKWNKFDVISEIELNAEQLRSAFETTDKNIQEKKG